LLVILVVDTSILQELFGNRGFYRNAMCTLCITPNLNARANGNSQQFGLPTKYKDVFDARVSTDRRLYNGDARLKAFGMFQGAF